MTLKLFVFVFWWTWERRLIQQDLFYVLNIYVPSCCSVVQWLFVTSSSSLCYGVLQCQKKNCCFFFVLCFNKRLTFKCVSVLMTLYSFLLYLWAFCWPLISVFVAVLKWRWKCLCPNGHFSIISSLLLSENRNKDEPFRYVFLSLHWLSWQWWTSGHSCTQKTFVRWLGSDRVLSDVVMTSCKKCSC